jgi:hypothetical protein
MLKIEAILILCTVAVAIAAIITQLIRNRR